jgi:transposase-like protein
VGNFSEQLWGDSPERRHRSIFALGTAKEVSARWDEVDNTLTERFPKAAALMTDAKADVLAFTAFPRAHWRKVWSNNPISVNRLLGDTVQLAA